MSIHPSVPKRCVPVIQQALGPGWRFDRQLLVPQLGLVFKFHDTATCWEVRFIWCDQGFEHPSFQPSYDCRIPPRLLLGVPQATAAATALVKLQGWDTGTLPDYAELEMRVTALQGKQVTVLSTGRAPGVPVFQHIKPRRK